MSAPVPPASPSPNDDAGGVPLPNAPHPSTPPPEEGAALPDAKALYDARDYGACIEACRRIWRERPSRREGIRFLYAWSIYHSVLKAKEATAGELARALDGIAKICPGNELVHPHSAGVFRVANWHLSAASPRYGAAVTTLDRLDPTELITEPEVNGQQTYPSQRERWYMLRSKALEKDHRYEDALACVQAALDDSAMVLTDKNPLHLGFRKAQCLHALGRHEEALALAVDVEPQLRQSYVDMLCGRCAHALDRPLEALGFLAAAMLANRKPDFSMPAFRIIAEDHERLEVDAGVARDHARLDNAVRAHNGWPIKEYAVLPEIDDDERRVPQLLRELKAVWREWAPLRHTPSTGTVKAWILDGRLGFIRDDSYGDDLIVQGRTLRREAAPKNTRVAYRRRRAYDKKKGKLGWEAVGAVVS